MDQTDDQLLRQFDAARDQDAFAAIVRRHSDLVYASARRQVRDPALAEDITQAVFVVLSRKARGVDGARLAGWLLGTTRLIALSTRRDAGRRAHHERQAAALNTIEVAAGVTLTVGVVLAAVPPPPLVPLFPPLFPLLPGEDEPQPATAKPMLAVPQPRHWPSPLPRR